jgi:DNA-directed RNA polymerase subunit RPC12/RpoP
MTYKAKCPHCGSDQLDTVSFNMDCVRCRKCGKAVSGLELLQQHVENITCPRCRHRHPASRSCEEAKRLADLAREERERLAERDHWMEETWEMIELCAASKGSMRVSLTPAGCEELLKLKRQLDELQKSKEG